MIFFYKLNRIAISEYLIIRFIVALVVVGCKEKDGSHQQILHAIKDRNWTEISMGIHNKYLWQRRKLSIKWLRS